MRTILRALVAFAFACLIAGLVIVLFVNTPAELMTLPLAQRLQSLESTGILILAAATHSAIFAAPFALIAILLGAILKNSSIFFYSLAGLAISLFGFAALHLGTTTQATTILNLYAGSAYALSGLVGGYVYWLLAGRYIARPGKHRPEEVYEPSTPKAITSKSS